MQISKEAAHELTRMEHWVPWLLQGARVIFILIGAWIAVHIAKRVLNGLRAYSMHAMERRGETPQVELEKRATTIVATLGKLAAIIIWLIAVVMSLHELAFNIQPILAGFGVAGLAVGLGAQALIKDWLGGLLILIEDQIRIGDGVTINGTSGVVEEINLRTTILRGDNGAVHIISNGLINTLSNSTREYAYYVFQASIAYGSDVDRAFEVIAETGAELAADVKFGPMILAPIEVMGVDRFGDRGLVIRARIRTLASRRDDIGYELNRRVILAFMSADIAFAPPGVVPPVTGRP
jgi:small conductance mechanosensitive channel